VEPLAFLSVQPTVLPARQVRETEGQKPSCGVAPRGIFFWIGVPTFVVHEGQREELSPSGHRSSKAANAPAHPIRSARFDRYGMAHRRMSRRSGRS